MHFLHLKHDEIIRIALKIAFIVLCVEGLIMFVLLPPLDPYINEYVSGAIDTCTLVIVSTPLIINYVLKPYVLGLERALASLKKSEQEILRTTKRLQLTKERYALAAKGVNDGLWDWDLNKNKLFFSARWKEIMGWRTKHHKANLETWISLIHPDDQEKVLTAFENSHVCRTENRQSIEFRIPLKNEEVRWVEMRWICMCTENQATRLIGSILDITEKKKMEKDLAHGALHDALTGLPNRVLLNERLTQALSAYTRNPNMKFSLLFIDLDNFKRINDTLGHSAGDELLLAIAKRLLISVRTVDTVARLGGDEFAILLLGVHTKAHLSKVMGRINETMKAAVFIEKQEIYPGLSMGVVTSSDAHHGVGCDKILSDADMALYRAKHEGKGRFAIFDVAMREKQKRLFDISNSLMGALDRKELTLYYQPIMDLRNLRVAGFEALMRWHHPVYGGLSPDVFIPLAEESELIHKLGIFALDEALMQLHRWNNKFGHTKWHMCVNVSSKQLLHPQFFHLLNSAITRGKVLPSQVVLEITEGIIAKYCPNTEALLQQIKTIGVKLSIDDFGTGNSSLSTFRQYPFDVLKIDKSFVGEKVTQKQTKAFIKVIQTLAKLTSVKTVAEGIETPEQHAFLRKMGCDFGQGYLFSKPMPWDQIEAILTHDISLGLRATQSITVA